MVVPARQTDGKLTLLSAYWVDATAVLPDKNGCMSHRFWPGLRAWWWTVPASLATQPTAPSPAPVRLTIRPAVQVRTRVTPRCVWRHCWYGLTTRRTFAHRTTEIWHWACRVPRPHAAHWLTELQRSDIGRVGCLDHTPHICLQNYRDLTLGVSGASTTRRTLAHITTEIWHWACRGLRPHAAHWLTELQRSDIGRVGCLDHTYRGLILGVSGVSTTRRTLAHRTTAMDVDLANHFFALSFKYFSN